MNKREDAGPAVSGQGLPLSGRSVDKELAYDLLRAVLDRSQNSRLSGDLAGRLRDLPAETWQVLLEEAGRHRVTPLLYHYLSASASAGLIPGPVLELMRKAYYLTLARNMLLFSGLKKALAALKQAGIPAVLLKGSHLALAVYKDIGLRPMSDLDLLLRSSDLEQAVPVLAEAGFTSAGRFFIADQVPVHQHLTPLQNKEGAVLELHWNISNPLASHPIKPEELWARAEAGQVDGMDLLLLCPEDLLIHICLHAGRHRFNFGLAPLCDIAEILTRHGDTLDWERLCLTARKWQATRTVYLCLLLARDLLGAAVSEALLERFRPAKAEPQLIAWAHEIVRDGCQDAVPVTFRFPQVLAGRTPGGRIRNLWQIIFIEKKLLALQYAVSSASPFLYFYYVVRLKDIFLRHSGTVLRLLLREKKTAEKYDLVSKGNAVYDWLSGK
ncbi:MAG: nucleotidyltransferase domain-containing protein [Thermodesulfovibrionales bacterium]